MSLEEEAIKLWVELGREMKVPEEVIPRFDEEKFFHLKKGKYLHNKSGNVYELLHEGIHTETGETLIVYSRIGENQVYVRPKWMFTERVEIDGKKVPRFTYIEDQGI